MPIKLRGNDAVDVLAKIVIGIWVFKCTRIRKAVSEGITEQPIIGIVGFVPLLSRDLPTSVQCPAKTDP
ncbi:MAG: hypothetical protein Tsb0033_15880 [Winogradskyella sp.]